MRSTLQISPDLDPPKMGEWACNKFYIVNVLAVSPDSQIGYAVMSRNKLNAFRKHFSWAGNEPKGWATALAKCEEAARGLQEEADANRAHSEAARQAAIVGSSPTADVDAWIIANMGYTAETLAALAKSTRRNRRREARQQMA